MHRLIANEQHEREAAAYTPVGRCVLQVHLQANVITVSLPEKPQAVYDEKVIQALNRGIKLTLKPTQKL